MSVSQLLESLFRREAGRITAGLVRVLGSAHLETVEDAVQDALVQALRLWPFHGVPEQPAAWLTQVARHKAIDRLRHDKLAAARAAEHGEALAAKLADTLRAAPRAALEDPERVEDDQLRLIFICCHPSLPREARIALTLKAVCGFGVPEIARAFLVSESAIAQRLVRSKRFLEQHAVEFAVPSPAELPQRLAAVLEVLYSLFNEGYAAHRGEALIRKDVIDEALRLGELLVHNPALATPELHALVALMWLQGARWPARVDGAGDLLTLAQQDRRLWDREWLARGFAHFELACAGDELTAYHVQAAIATCHAGAMRFEDTDWAQILSHYDVLMRSAPSAIVALNRVVALAHAEGPDAALQALDAIADDPQLQSYYLLPAVRAELLLRRGDRARAADALREAIALPCSEPERAFLQRKLARI